MDAQKFGNYIATVRKERGMTQADLAKLLHVTDKAVSKWERGLSLPDISNFEPLADALGVSIVELFKSEKLESEQFTPEIANSVVADTFAVAKDQNKKLKKTVVIVLALIIVLLSLVFVVPFVAVRVYQGNRVMVNLYIIEDGETVSLIGDEYGYSLKNSDGCQTLTARANEYGRFEYSLFAKLNNGDTIPLKLTVTHFNWWEIIRSDLYIDIDTANNLYKVCEDFSYTAEGLIYHYKNVSKPVQTIEGLDNINVFVGYSG